MPVAHWSVFKVLKIKEYEILSSKFEQGVGKHEWQVADLQNVIQVQAFELDVINRQLRFHESQYSHIAATKSWSAENFLFQVRLFSTMYAFY